MTAEMTADGLPIPAAEPAPPVAEEGPADGKPRRGRRKAFLLLFLLGLLAMLATIAAWYLLFRQPIPLPLPGIPESQVPKYATAVYGSQRPAGVAVSPSGDRIYVTDSEGARTGLVFDAGGNKLGAMVPPAETGTDHAPVYLAVDPLTGEVYVSDRLAGTIYVYDRDGVYQREFTLAVPRPGWQPLGLAFDRAGSLYVTDLSGPYQKVLVIDRKAQVTRTLGENEKLNFPNGVAADAAGDVFVTDSNNGRLLMFDPSGKVRAQVGRGAGQGNLGLPRGIAVDDQGRVFVADATGQGVFVYRAPSGESRRLDFLGLVGEQGAADGQFAYPNSVAVDGRGRVYVADTFNDRVQIWSY
ncbi:MAG: SMP-30/gluconolactonase/LRE family protein [Chloroflexi bacterium]|nr:SMP-30/gluconolactonase/LRE family protein [Chloroflexota bacterium]